MLLISSAIEFWIVKVVPKYLNSSTLSKVLLSILTPWIRPAFWSRDVFYFRTTFHTVIKSRTLVYAYDLNCLRYKFVVPCTPFVNGPGSTAGQCKWDLQKHGHSATFSPKHVGFTCHYLSTSLHFHTLIIYRPHYTVLTMDSAVKQNNSTFPSFLGTNVQWWVWYKLSLNSGFITLQQ